MLVFVMPSCLFLVPCGFLQGGAGLVARLCVVISFVFVAFPCGVSGRVWYLAVSIPDPCLLLVFE